MTINYDLGGCTGVDRLENPAVTFPVASTFIFTGTLPDGRQLMLQVVFLDSNNAQIYLKYKFTLACGNQGEFGYTPFIVTKRLSLAP